MPALIVLAYLSLLTLGLLDNVRGPFLFEIQRDLDLSGTGGSAFFAASSLLAFVGSWYSHRLLRGRDPLRVLAFASVVMTIGFAAVSRSMNFALLLVSAGVFGWAYGTLNALQNVIVSEAAPVASRRRYLGGLQGMYGLAAWLAPMTATSLRLAGLDWRTIFLALAALPVFVAVPAWYFRGRVQTHAPEVLPLNKAERLACAGFAALLAIYLWGELSISTRLVLWLRTRHEFSAEAADSQLALFFVLMLAGRLFLALVHLKIISNWLILMVSVLASSVLYFLGLKVSPYFVAYCGLTLAPFFPVILDQIATTFGAKSSRAMGVIIGVGNLSIVAMHLSVGALTDLFNLSAALIVGPAALLIAGCAILALQLKGSRWFIR